MFDTVRRRRRPQCSAVARGSNEDMWQVGLVPNPFIDRFRLGTFGQLGLQFLPWLPVFCDRLDFPFHEPVHETESVALAQAI